MERRGDLNRTWVLAAVLVFLFLFLLPGGLLFARGVQENRIAKATELVKDKNYNDAMLILAEVVQEEPDRFDEAQELISQINRQRSLYNQDYEALINLLYVQKDEATALKVIAQLEALDKNPNKQTQDGIKLAKRTARLISNNKRYADIMTRARAALDRRAYGTAVQIYLEGQDLAKDMFLESGFGNVLTDQVDRTWSDLKAASALFVEAETRLKTLPDQGTALLASESPSLPALDQLLASMNDLAAWRQRAWTDGRFFRSQSEFLLKNARQSDFFLDYSYRFVNGPADAQGPEGILGALDRLWAEVLTPWTAQIRTGVDNRYLQAKAALDRGDFTTAAEAFEGLRVRSRRGLDVVSLWNRQSGIDESGALDPAFRTRLAQVLPLGLWLEHRLAVAVQGLKAVRDLPRGAALAASEGLDRTGLESARAEVRAQKDSFDEFARTSGRWALQTQSLVAGGWVPLDPAVFGTGWQGQWATYRQGALTQEAGFVDRRGTLDYGLLDGRFQALQATLAEARTQVEGALKFPLQASARLQDLRPLQDVLAGDIGTFIALYDTESADVKTPAVQRWPVRGRDLLARMTAAQTLQAQLLAAARANYAQSQALKKQGQDLVPQIDTAISANSAEGFARADSVLGQVTARYNQSLALQEDPAFRIASDAEVLALAQKIAEARNKWLIAQVQKFVDEGSQAYLGQEFQRAKNVLTRAQSLWATYYPKDPNPEVEYWLTLAIYATSVASGRELTPLDPLYNEVQQLLNSARRSLSLGQARVAQGDREGGLELMRQARETLGKVLLPFPLNQKARVLNLEILQASDPENFPVLFKQNFDAAVKKIAVNPKESLGELEDLKSIQADYPGLEAALTAVNLKLFPPKVVVTNDTVKKVQDFLTRAGRLFAEGAGTEAQRRAALDQVLEAQKLDPTNRAASALAARIRSSLPPPTLTGPQRTEFALIQKLVVENDFATARQRLDSFLRANPGTERVSDVIRLGARIDANL